MEKISQSQLAALIIMFQIGSSPLFLLASQAGKDAWISVFVGMLCGLLLLMGVTLPIHRLEPDKSLAEILCKYFGKWFGSFFALAYIVYFSYKAVRNVREFGDLMSMYLLPTTPVSVIMLLFLLMAGYAVFHGIEVFVRITEIVLPCLILIYILLFTMIIGNGLVDITRIQPLFMNGIKPVLEAAIPEVISFPFGEMVLFLVFWRTVASSKRTTKVSIACYIFAGITITLSNMIIIASLGPLSAMTVVPFMEIISLVRVADFIERLDPLVALLLFTGVFIKMTAYYFGAVLTLHELFKLDRRIGALIIGAVIFIGSLLFRSYMQQVTFGFDFNIKFHFHIFQIILPAVLLLMMVMRSNLRKEIKGHRVKQKKDEGSDEKFGNQSR